jgi:hypothetical protein
MMIAETRQGWFRVEKRAPPSAALVARYWVFVFA